MTQPQRHGAGNAQRDEHNPYAKRTGPDVEVGEHGQEGEERSGEGVAPDELRDRHVAVREDDLEDELGQSDDDQGGAAADQKRERGSDREGASQRLAGGHMPNDVRKHDLRGRQRRKQDDAPNEAEAAYSDALASSKKCRTTKTSTFVRMASESASNPTRTCADNSVASGTAPTGDSVVDRAMNGAASATISTPTRPDSAEAAMPPATPKPSATNPTPIPARNAPSTRFEDPSKRNARKPVSSALVNGTTNPMATAQPSQ